MLVGGDGCARERSLGVPDSERPEREVRESGMQKGAVGESVGVVSSDASGVGKMGDGSRRVVAGLDLSGELGGVGGVGVVPRGVVVVVAVS